MGYEFSAINEATVDATVDEVWEAIATGPGIDSWFMGHTDVADGAVRLAFGDYMPVQTITAEEPGRRFAYGAAPDPDGRFIAYDFLIEARGGGSTSLRLVTNGFLPGDDWADEYEAMSKGGAMYFATLVAYLTHFAGRHATSITVAGPKVTDWPAAWGALGGAFGLDRPAVEGDEVTAAIDGRTQKGTVYFVNDASVAIRTADALYRFVRGFAPGGGPAPLLAMHNLFVPGIDPKDAERTWSAWLANLGA
jgi:uncharacterized protein YndB with AHSA1/START domain